MEGQSKEYCNKCGGELGSTSHVCPQQIWQVAVTQPPLALLTLPGSPCPGCGMAYLTCTVNPMYPHDFATCEAYHRGFRDGQALAKLQRGKDE